MFVVGRECEVLVGRDVWKNISLISTFELLRPRTEQDQAKLIMEKNVDQEVAFVNGNDEYYLNIQRASVQSQDRARRRPRNDDPFPISTLGCNHGFHKSFPSILESFAVVESTDLSHAILIGNAI